MVEGGIPNKLRGMLSCNCFSSADDDGNIENSEG